MCSHHRPNKINNNGNLSDCPQTGVLMHSSESVVHLEKSTLTLGVRHHYGNTFMLVDAAVVLTYFC